jgi:hypothetical protein
MTRVGARGGGAGPTFRMRPHPEMQASADLSVGRVPRCIIRGLAARLYLRPHARDRWWCVVPSGDQECELMREHHTHRTGGPTTRLVTVAHRQRQKLPPVR